MELAELVSRPANEFVLVKPLAFKSSCDIDANERNVWLVNFAA